MTIDVKVYPRSKIQKITKDKQGLHKIHLLSAPVRGKANDEMVKMLAKHFDIPRTNILILSGYNSRTKTIKIGKK
jgi:uncharacterized protein